MQETFELILMQTPAMMQSELLRMGLLVHWRKSLLSLFGHAAGGRISPNGKEEATQFSPFLDIGSIE